MTGRAGAGAYCAAYLFLFYRELSTRPGLPTDMDIATAVVGLTLLLEAAKGAGCDPREAGMSGRHLEHVLAACQSFTAIRGPIVRDFAESAIDYIEANGIATWIHEVRTRHQSTYQHCLLVAGLVSRFAVLLGLSRNDVITLTETGLVHDVGKARIPVAILDKPGKLTDAEMDIVRQHPQWGHDHLSARSDATADVLDGVLHHHEPHLVSRKIQLRVYSTSKPENQYVRNHAILRDLQ